MKIAILVDNIYIPYGLSRAVLNLSNILTAYGINVHIASRHSIAGASIPFCVTSEIKIHDLGGDELPKSFLQKCRLNIKLLQNFCKLIKKEKFDIIH